MAIDATYAPQGALTMPRWIVEGAFTGLLLLVFVGLMPFKPVAFPFTTVGQVSTGDSLHQAIFVLLFAIQAIGAIQRRSFAAVSALPPVMGLLMGWCLLSAAWSAVPDVTVRRAMLQLVLVVSVAMAVDGVGVARSFAILRQLLIVILLINFASVFVLKNARHLVGEDDPGLIGDWRGLYIHKNIAGAVTAITAIILLNDVLLKRRWSDMALLLLALAFLAGTRAKTSIGFLPLALVIGAAYRWSWRSDLDRAIVCVCGAIGLVVLGAIIAIKLGTIHETLADPQGFTGRSIIWAAQLGFIADHPLLGAGYGTFADTGTKSPLTDYISSGWIEVISHGHNAYLEMLVTIGSVGFVIAMVEFLAIPLARFWRRCPGEDFALKSLLFTIFVFIVLHNLLESDFLDRDGPVWTAFLMVTASLRIASRSRGAGP